MKNKILLILIFLLFSCGGGRKLNSEDENPLKISYDFYILEDGFVQFDIDYFIPYSKLIFTREEDGFNSNITLSVDVIDVGSSILYNNSWTEDIHVDYFEKTKYKKDYIGHFSFKIKTTDEPLMKLFINDYTNRKYYRYEENLIVSDYGHLSDLKLYIESNNAYLDIDYLDNSELEELDTLWIKYQVIDDTIDNNSVRFEVLNKNINGNNVLKYEIPSTDLDNYMVNLHPVPVGNMTYSKLVVNCYYKDVHKIKSIILKKDEEIIVDYTVLLKPMESYILNRQEYVDYADLDSTKKVEYVENYWLEKNDPSLLIEFYKRVKYANSNFKKIGNPGSNSDQGRIYITYGRPLDVDFEFNENGEFEIWQYRNKKFIFINRFGYYECYQC